MSNQYYNYQQQPYQTAYPYYYYPPTSPAYYPAYNNEHRQQPNQPSDIAGMLPMEQSYIENILRLNRGKHVKVYMTIENNTKAFEGVIEAAGRDHLILSDPETGQRYLLLMVYLDYIVFDEKINYDYAFVEGVNQQLSNYPPR